MNSKSYYVLECQLESGNGPCYYECLFEKSDDGLEEMKELSKKAYKIYNVWEGVLFENNEILNVLRDNDDGKKSQKLL